jgi:BirA family biotin operon repressor/biotin-[acetyl-CoA-carboxylase] ligase
VQMENLTPESILSGLNTRFIGQKIIYYPALDSTMDAAKREAQWGVPAGTVVITEEQTAGRGRLQRAWITPKGGLALSIILRPNLDYLPYLVMLASLAVTFAIQVVTGLKPQIKWPNDVLINEKKVCGILIENDLRKNTLRHSVIGIGINVNLHMANYPEIASRATSLSDQLGQEVSRLALTRQLFIEVERLYLSLPKGASIFEQWKSRLATLGQIVRVNSNGMIYRGVAESVTSDGNLLLRQKDGHLIKIIAGDVTLR